MLRRSWALVVLVAACSQEPAPPPAPPLASDASLASAQALDVADAARPSPAAPAECTERGEITIFTSPKTPRVGAPLRVLAVTEKLLEGALVIRSMDGVAHVTTGERHGGPPYWWFAEIPAPPAGAYRAELQSTEGACKEFTVEADPAPDKSRTWNAVWGVHAAWTPAVERLYSAWIEKLFDAPPDEQPTWPALHDVLRDKERNLLHDFLGQGEDDAGPHALLLEPDCADLPYFLRGYFAFKLGLPFGFSSCTRGGGGQAPRCMSFHSNIEARPQRRTVVDTFGDFLRITVADTVHSGTGRAPAEAEGSDYYPVPITRESLRPGTIYADPYGHVLVIAKRLAQTESAGGVLFAVDGQPDGTVARRRFWRGNFLFALDPSLGSPGWKRFRPVVVTAGRARALSNQEIKDAPGYGDYSLTQYEAGVEGFYDRMEDVLSPAPQGPSRALMEAIQALTEQVKGRVLSVGNGQKYWATGGAKIDMPEGASIFESTGPWEDFSTPSRDLRLLIAIDVVTGFPARVERRPSRYAMPAGKSAEEIGKELSATLSRELADRRFSYARSDGSAFSLTLAEVVARAVDLEVAYNPNDCAEVRWGAPEGSAERSTCKLRAPPGQAAQMRRHRAWFHERKRPRPARE